MTEIELKIDEMPQSHVGYGVAIIDPQIIEENNWQAGQILELSANKKAMSSYGQDFQRIVTVELSVLTVLQDTTLEQVSEKKLQLML